MLAFYWNIFPVSKEYAKTHGNPNIILASSVHPLTLVAGIKVARKFSVPCICEIRDLWPESIVEFGNLNKNSFIAKILYSGEKWIYKYADRLVFTMEGGKDYIVDRGWDKNSGGPVSIEKIVHINNGIDLNAFDANVVNHVFEDKDLNNEEIFKVIYAGQLEKQ